MKEAHATYNLERIKQLITDGNGKITTSAHLDAVALRFTDEDIYIVVRSLEEVDFYKTMESTKCPGFWQDVYHKQYQGVALYVKLQIVEQAVVISFKEDTSKG